MTHKPSNRLALNVPGPFYTTGECMACGAPEDEAPTLLEPFAPEDLDTYFVRQPETAQEIEQACRALQVCCVNALRYGGRDRTIISRLGNTPDYCDYVIAWWGGLVQAIPKAQWWQVWRRRAAI